MFTGIIEHLGIVVASSGRRLEVAAPVDVIADLALGGSVAVNGVCLTVAGLLSDAMVFEVSEETTRLTNLEGLNAGDRVNLERSLRFGMEVGGHLISGHVDGRGKITGISGTDGWLTLGVTVDSHLARYLFRKGYIALDGISLTIADLDVAKGEFLVSLVPETVRRTNLQFRSVGDEVNIEIERLTQVLVDSIERVMRPVKAAGGD